MSVLFLDFVILSANMLVSFSDVEGGNFVYYIVVRLFDNI